MKKFEKVDFGFTPYPHQEEVFDCILHKKMKKLLMICHRGGGKDKTFFNTVLNYAMTRVGTVFYVFPTLSQGRKALWEMIDNDGKRLIEYIPKELLWREPKQDTMQIFLRNPSNLKKPGSVIQIVGSYGPAAADKLRGANPMMWVLSEAAFMHESIMKILSPRLEQNNAVLMINSTPQGHNWLKTLWDKAKKTPEFKTLFYTYKDTCKHDGSRIVSEKYVAEALEDGTMTQGQVNTELLCDWDAATEGSVFGESLDILFKKGKISDSMEISTRLPVHSFWDIGINEVSGRTAIWLVQIHNGAPHFIKYFEDFGKTASQYCELVRSWVMSNNLLLGTAFLPSRCQFAKYCTRNTIYRRGEKLRLGG